MSALHWICALTLALVCSISALPVKRSLAGQTQLTNTTEKFKIDIKDKCPNDMRLYSPTNVHEDCLFSALNCTILELDVIEAECNVTQIIRTFRILKRGLSRQWDTKGAPSSTQDCTCESNNTTDVDQFLTNLKSLVEQLNSRTPVIM